MPIGEYKMIKYPFEVYKTVSDGRILWVAKSTRFNGCIGRGAFLSDSLADLAVNEKKWIESQGK